MSVTGYRAFSVPWYLHRPKSLALTHEMWPLRLDTRILAPLRSGSLFSLEAKSQLHQEAKDSPVQSKRFDFKNTSISRMLWKKWACSGKLFFN